MGTRMSSSRRNRSRNRSCSRILRSRTSNNPRSHNRSRMTVRMQELQMHQQEQKPLQERQLVK